jgi:hypothetical protein
MKTIHSLSENLSEGMILPKGSSDERGNPEAGYFRYNTDDKKIEVFDGTDWANMDYAPSYVASGLALHFDAGNPNSYGGTGSTWSDLSQGGNNGSITSASYNSEGYFTFDGSNDYVDTSYNPSITTTTEYTYEFWLKTPSSISAWSPLLDLYGGVSSNNETRLMAIAFAPWVSDKIYVKERVNNTTVELLSDYSVIDGNWHQICVVATSSVLEIYVDGSSASSTASRVNASGLVSNSLSHSYMTKAVNKSDCVAGDLGIVRFYMDKALSASEVTQNFNANKSRFGL